MFYNQEYFQRRKGGLGIYWLAATLGSSSAFKKLSKKEIMDCNIPKAVDKLIHPEEPLALRLTSNLMFGVTRIYSYQCNYLHQNATTTSSSLKHAVIQLSMPQQGSKGRDALATLTLTTHDTVANGDKNQKGNASRGVREGGIRITLDRDEGMDLLGDLGDLGQLFDGGMDLTWEALREELNSTTLKGKRRRNERAPSTPGLDGEDYMDQLEDDEYIEKQSAKKKAKTKVDKSVKEAAPTAPKRSTTIGRPEDINLPAHLMDEQQLGGDARDLQPLFGDELGFDPMFEPDYDFNLGLEDLPPPLNVEDEQNAHPARRPRDSSLTNAGELLIPGGNGGPDTSGVGGDGFDFGLDGGDPYNAFGAGADFNFDAARVVGENVDLRVEGLENGRAASVALGMGENGAEAEHGEDMKEANGPPTPPPSDGQDLNAINAEEGQNNANGAKKASSTTKKGKKKAQQPVRDKFTTLHADDITRNREAYSGEMKKANLARDLQIFERGQKEKVMEMMTALPLGVKAPALENFFKDALNLNDLLRIGAKGKKAKEAASKRPASTVNEPSLPDEDLSMTTRIRGAREGSVLSSQLGRGGYKEGRHDDFDFDQVFDNGNVDDPAMFGGQMDDFQYDGFADGTGGAFENEHGRPSSVAPSVARSFSLGARKDRASSVFAGESNYGRDPAGSFSIMPWNASYSSAQGFEKAPSSIARYSMSRGGSVPPTPGGPRSRSSSMLAGSMLNGRAASRAETLAFGDINPYYEHERTPSRAETPGKHLDSRAPSLAPSLRGREASPVPQHIHSDSQVGETESQVELRLETESRNFFRYAKTFAQPPVNEFLLSDIIPVAATAPIVAAQGFYHTLMLASKGLLKVHEQEEAYGEIRLSIASAFHQSQSQSPAIAV